MNNSPLNPSESLDDVLNSDFVMIVQKKLRFSKRNTVIHSNNKGISRAVKESSEVNSKKFLQFEEGLKLGGSSCFMLFVLRSKSIRDLMPDIEFLKYSKVCSQMISKISNCPEAHFGLGMLEAYEGDFDTALQHLKVAFIESNDPEIQIWSSVLTLFRVNSRRRAFQSYRLLSDLQKQVPTSIEVNWALMILSLGTFLKPGSEIQNPEHFASKLIQMDQYFGLLAWSEIFLRTQSQQLKGEILLKELINLHPYKPEAYLKLWNYYYYSTLNYESALEVVEKAYLQEIKTSSEYSVVICLNYARSLFKNKKIRSCLELLQLEYTKHSIFTVILYHYGRLCVKSKEQVFLGSAIGALEETLKTCSETRHGQIYYWLTFAYKTAEEKIEAFNCAKKSIQLLNQKLQEKHCYDPKYDRRMIRKIESLQEVVDEFNFHMMEIETFEAVLEDSPPIKIEECIVYKDSICEFDLVEGRICEANMWWKAGKYREAKEVLYSQLACTRAKMKVFFRLIEFCNRQGNFEEMHCLTKDLVKRCRSPIIPVQVWVSANILYAKCLEKQNRVNEALLIYKSLAQVQPIPFIPDLDYTRELQRSFTKEDLENVVFRVTNKEKRYSYLTNSLQDYHLQRSKLVCSRQYISLAFMGDEDEESEINSVRSRTTSTERSESELVGSRAPEPLPKSRISSIPCGDSANIGFSVTTAYFFLYKIGKICAKYENKLNEGIFALHDFLNTHHYWGREGFEIDEETKVKAKYWLGVIFYKIGEFNQANETFQDILSMLFQLGRTKMSSNVQRYLKVIGNI